LIKWLLTNEPLTKRKERINISLLDFSFYWSAARKNLNHTIVFIEIVKIFNRDSFSFSHDILWLGVGGNIITVMN